MPWVTSNLREILSSREASKAHVAAVALPVAWSSGRPSKGANMRAQVRGSDVRVNVATIQVDRIRTVVGEDFSETGLRHCASKSLPVSDVHYDERQADRCDADACRRECPPSSAIGIPQSAGIQGAARIKLATQP